jgi:hypothetical protein
MPKRKISDHPELLGMPEVRKLWQTEVLFSDHNLKARLSKNDWWPSDAEAQPIWEFCKALYEKRAFALRRFDNPTRPAAVCSYIGHGTEGQQY